MGKEDAITAEPQKGIFLQGIYNNNESTSIKISNTKACYALLRGSVGFTHLLPTTVVMGARVNFSNPRNHSGVVLKEIIPPDGRLWY